MKLQKSLLLGISVLLLSACTWVKLTAEGDKVRVLSAEEIGKCVPVGKTSVQTAAKVAGFRRHEEKVQEELNTLARNSAVEIDGDTVVPLGEIEEGRQVFAVYRCMPQ